jgi:hypothetical protein
MVSHFTPMEINSSDLFSSHFSFHHQWGVISSDFFFSATNGGSLQVIFLFTPMGGRFKGFFIPMGFISSLF